MSFLDYDDYIYPDAYCILIEELHRHSVAAAFGRVEVAEMEMIGSVAVLRRRRTPYDGFGVVDLFRDNFCPIHSYVIARDRVRARDLRFDSKMKLLEDYEFLMRFCANYPVFFAHKHVVIGDYVHKNDSSNSLAAGGSATSTGAQELRRAQAVLEEMRRTTVVSLAVQRMVGLRDGASPITVADLIKLVTSDV
jgi:hypothetical protein